MKIIISLLIILPLVLSGCAQNQAQTNAEKESQVSSEIKPIEEEGQVSSAITQIEEESQVSSAITPIEEESQVSSEMSLEEQERTRRYVEELRKNYLEYLIMGKYPPAEKDKDLRSIVKFIFSHRRHWNAYEEAVYGDEGRGLVIDKKYGKVYYNPNEVTEILNRVEISAEYREEDLDGLIKMIEESGMRDWNDGYTGIGLGNAPLVKWAVGIEYDDGTIERHGVIKEDDENSPSAEEFKILTDYIREKGEEITARYNEENAAKGNGSRGSSAP